MRMKFTLAFQSLNELPPIAENESRTVIRSSQMNLAKHYDDYRSNLILCWMQGQNANFGEPHNFFDQFVMWLLR